MGVWVKGLRQKRAELNWDVSLVPLRGDREVHPQWFPFYDDQAVVIEPLFQSQRDCVWGPAVSQQEGEGQLALRTILWVSSALPAPYTWRHSPSAHLQAEGGQAPLALVVPLHPSDVCGVSKTTPQMGQHSGEGKLTSSCERLLLCPLVLEDYTTKSIHGVARVLSPGCLNEWVYQWEMWEPNTAEIICGLHMWESPLVCYLCSNSSMYLVYESSLYSNTFFLF